MLDYLKKKKLAAVRDSQITLFILYERLKMFIQETFFMIARKYCGSLSKADIYFSRSALGACGQACQNSPVTHFRVVTH